MWPNPQKAADSVTFTEEILNGKLHFLCIEMGNGLFFSRRKLKIAILSRLWHVNEYFLENSVMCMWEADKGLFFMEC